MTTTKASRHAGAALTAAVANEEIHRRAAQLKGQAAEMARAKCAELVTHAASGAEVDAGSLLRMQDEVRVATAEFDIASAVQRGAEKRRQEAEISVWFEQAEKLRKDVERSLDERCAAAAAVDLSLAELERAVACFNEAGRKFSGARIAASVFAADREVRMAANPILAEMPTGTHPNAKHHYGAEVRQVKAAVFDATGGLERQMPIASLAQREALLWGRKLTKAKS